MKLHKSMLLSITVFIKEVLPGTCTGELTFLSISRVSFV